MKKGEKKITMSIRWFYSFIFLGILSLFVVGVYAYNTGSPTTSGHTWNEIAGIPAGFADGVDNEGSSLPAHGWYGSGTMKATQNECWNAVEPVYASGSCYCRDGYTRLIVGAYYLNSNYWLVTCYKN